ncbi:hypothetical protein [Curtobacterium sp. 20TX0008]|uniref:hypothetical protein n=1 Tax=Curtobacterium sp. 20TX0008 TaxID=3022018 RepID=UPI00232AB92B|nr:hypothetical protein [Curtobacterium sp. 20TX0008]MDB6427445.1 hypothetical protein [Curtobacterium sp. 20TX0008]
MTPDDRLFGMQTRTWGLPTEWCNSAIDALARFQYSAEEHRQEGEAIRQITGLERQTQRIEGAERHRYIGLIVYETDLDITARWGTSPTSQEGTA